MDEFSLSEPSSAQDWERYFDLRWRVLRQPHGLPRGSERDSLDSETIHAMLVDENRNVVGVGRLHLLSDQEAQVRYMAIESALTGRGFGGRILHELERRAAKKNVRSIILNARSTAVPFYKKNGYEIVRPGETLFGTVEHFVMRKELR